MQFAQDQIKQFLSGSPDQEKLEQFLQAFKLPTNLAPTKYLHQINLKQQKEPILVYAQLMVQDIRDKQYYYPLFIKKPFTPDSQFRFVKYGGQYLKPEHQEQMNQMVQSEQYAKVMRDRQVAICRTVRYQNKWLKQLKNQKQEFQIKNIKVCLDGSKKCKLGVTINCICYWDPVTQYLYHLQDLDQKQAIQVNLDPWNRIIEQQKNNPQFKLTTAKQKLLNLFSHFCSPRYANFLLFTLISNESFFISGENVQQIVNELVPRTFRLKVKAPFKNSLFPFKDQQSVLVQTPMQMSNESTFLLLDFSEITEKQQVKIENEQIDNLKALKLFVQDGTTIYRWEIGQSQIPHNHVGIIVKASKIVIPHFALKDQKFGNIQKTVSILKEMPEEQKMQLRSYIAVAKSHDPKLTSQQSEKIKISLIQEKDIPKGAFDFKQTMRVSKLLAMSEGRNNITHEDYKKTRQLIFAEFLNKQSMQEQ